MMVSDAAKLLVDMKGGALVVQIDESHVMGFLDSTSLLASVLGGQSMQTTTVGALVKEKRFKPPCAKTHALTSTTVLEALKMVTDNRVEHGLPVFSTPDAAAGGAIVGYISVRELMKTARQCRPNPPLAFLLPLLSLFRIPTAPGLPRRNVSRKYATTPRRRRISCLRLLLGRHCSLTSSE